MNYFLPMILSLVLSFGVSARLIPQIDLDQYSDGLDFDSLAQLGLNDTYRLGDEWGKKPITQADLDSNKFFKRMAMATAKVGGATGFYIGQHANKFVMATNHHVCETASDCMGSLVSFSILKLKFEVVEFYGSWPEIDLALFAIDVKDAQSAEMLKDVAANFTFGDIKHAQPILTIGYGIGDNPGQVIVANQDSDCVVFSKDKEYKLMADPDELNPAPYKAWSFATGCDVSHGDSGSAMMDRTNGNIIGIIWTGKIPKNAKVQSSAYLDELLERPNQDVWTELSYAVPAAKMKEVLSKKITDGEIAAPSAKVVKAVLGLENTSKLNTRLTTNGSGFQSSRSN